MIIHTAALTSIDECESNPDKAKKLNVEFTRKLVDWSRTRKSRFIFISTDIVFDGKEGNYSENDPTNPVNLYGKTKVEAENYILLNHPNAVIVRSALIYGKSLNGHSAFTEIMLKDIRNGKSVKVFTDQFRTPVLVDDLVSALWELVGHNYKGILHIGGPHKVSRMDIGKILCELFDFPSHLLISVKSTEGFQKVLRPLDCSLNTQLSRKILRTEFKGCHAGLKMAFLNHFKNL